MASRTGNKIFVDWIASQEWDVFGTLKFQPIRKIRGVEAHNLLRYFWNKMDRVIYGKAAERGCRVARWCFAHEGSYSDNFHLHFAAKSPIEIDLFCCLANTVWTKLDRATAGLHKNSITPIIHSHRVADYLVKEVWKLGSDSLDTTLTCTDPIKFEGISNFKDAASQRISRAMTANEFRAANAALLKHKVEVERNLALRDRKQSSKATCN